MKYNDKMPKMKVDPETYVSSSSSHLCSSVIGNDGGMI